MEPVYVVRVIRFPKSDFSRIYGDLVAFMHDSANSIVGCRDMHLYAGDTHTEILILAEFASRHQWAQAQWDRRLGYLLEEIVSDTETVYFGLCDGHAHVAAPRDRAVAAPGAAS